MERFIVGDRFTMFAEVEKKIHQYEKENFTKESRRIKAARKGAPHKNFNKDIVYSELVYSYIHGGKKFKSESIKERGQGWMEAQVDEDTLASKWYCATCAEENL